MGYSLWSHKEPDKAERLTALHYLNIWLPSVCDCILHPLDDRWSPCPSLSVPVKSVKPEFPLHLSCSLSMMSFLQTTSRPTAKPASHSSARNFIHPCPCCIQNSAQFYTEIVFLLWPQFQNKYIYHFNDCPGMAFLNGFCGFNHFRLWFFFGNFTDLYFIGS